MMPLLPFAEQNASKHKFSPFGRTMSVEQQIAQVPVLLAEDLQPPSPARRLAPAGFRAPASAFIQSDSIVVNVGPCHLEESGLRVEVRLDHVSGYQVGSSFRMHYWRKRSS